MGSRRPVFEINSFTTPPQIVPKFPFVFSISNLPEALSFLGVELVTESPLVFKVVYQAPRRTKRQRFKFIQMVEGNRTDKDLADILQAVDLPIALFRVFTFTYDRLTFEDGLTIN